MKKDDLIKMAMFLLCCLYVVGTVGGFFYLLWQNEVVMAIGVLVLAFMAWPTEVNYVKKLLDEE